MSEYIIYVLEPIFYALSWAFDSAGLMTLITGLIALWVYRRQEHKKIQESAIILMQEINFAEESMLTIKQMGAITQENCDILILPNNHWPSLSHYIIGTMTRDEFNAVDRFFRFTAGLEKTMRQIEESFCDTSIQSKAVKTQDAIIDILVQEFKDGNGDIERTQYEQVRNRLVGEFNKETWQFMPSLHTTRLHKNLALIPQINNTSAFQKLSIASDNLPWF